jgi:hypothetical protein
MLGFVFKQRQHGLVATVNAVEIADGQGALRRQLGVSVAAKDFHGRDYRFYSGGVRLNALEAGKSCV